jgi:hypothetical protein
VLGIVTAITVHDYFWVWRKDEWPRYIYHAEITTAADYMDGLPEDTFILYYSDRSPIDIEVIRFLAPDIEGSDRSVEWSDFNASIEVPDRTRPVAFVLLGGYDRLLPEIQERYPGGTTRVLMRDGKYDLTAYELPAD